MKRSLIESVEAATLDWQTSPGEEMSCDCTSFSLFFLVLCQPVFLAKKKKTGELSKPGRQHRMCELTGIPMAAKISCLNLPPSQDLP